MLTVARCCLSACWLLALAACAPAASAPARPRGSPGAPISADAAASAIAAARCEHEAACNQIGAGHDYATADACTAAFSSSALSDLRGHPCPGGIDSNHVRACAGILKRESCLPLSSLSRMYTCRPVALCIQVGEVRMSEEDVYGE